MIGGPPGRAHLHKPLTNLSFEEQASFDSSPSGRVFDLYERGTEKLRQQAVSPGKGSSPDCTFSPRVDPNSERLAQRYRQRQKQR